MGAHVTVFDVNINKLREVDAEFGGRIETRYSSILELEDAVKKADLVIGAVLVPGAKAPKLVTNSTVAHMKSGAVLVDIAIDQRRLLRGFAPHHPRRPDVRGARHAVLLRGQHARRGAPHIDLRADQRHHAVRAKAGDKGWKAACRADPALAKGLSTHEGELLSERWQPTSDLPYADPACVLALTFTREPRRRRPTVPGFANCMG